MTKDEMIRALRETHLVFPKTLFSLGLKAEDLAVYCYLSTFRDNETGECFPSYKTIGKTLKMGSTNTVRNCIRRLEAQGMITTEPTLRKKSDGIERNSTLLYTIYEVQDVREKRNWEEKRRADEVYEKQQIIKKAKRKGAHVTIDGIST